MTQQDGQQAKGTKGGQQAKGGHQDKGGQQVKGPKLTTVPAKTGTHPNHLPSRDVMEELAIRFVVNAPKDELTSFERIVFLIEQAHWFYEDTIREENTVLKSLSLREFTELMFQQCRSLKPYQKFVQEIYDSFTEYKHSVPVNGAIIINPTMDKCLLVKGWKSGSGWGFPKGKINREEADWTCAVREVEEEIGFNVGTHLVESGYIPPDGEPDSLTVHRGQQRTRLFIIPGVSEMTPFAPQTKKEIGDIKWHYIKALPNHSKVPDQGFKFFMVHAFVNQLNRWIAQQGGARPGTVQVDAQAGGPVWSALWTPPQEEPPAPPPPKVDPLLNFRFNTKEIMRAVTQGTSTLPASGTKPGWPQPGLAPSGRHNTT